MTRLPLLFMTAAAACLVVGVALGIGMGIAHDFQLAPVHAHANLVGWASLALMGVVTVQLGRAALADVPRAGLFLASAVVLLRWKVNLSWLLAGAAAIGLAASLVGWVPPQ